MCPSVELSCCCCRDRAEERRKGFNPDYERVNADLASIVTGNSLLEQDIGKISVEDSKFLGGDVDHTHLVKGLDYALLQKVPIRAPLVFNFTAFASFTAVKWHVCSCLHVATQSVPWHAGAWRDDKAWRGRSR
jgi:hypothetical protein